MVAISEPSPHTHNITDPCLHADTDHYDAHAHATSSTLKAWGTWHASNTASLPDKMKISTQFSCDAIEGFLTSNLAMRYFGLLESGCEDSLVIKADHDSSSDFLLCHGI
jgi:hypothetical protein